MKYKNKKILSGGVDRLVILSDPYAKSVLKSIQVEELPRGLDFCDSFAICGMKNGCIVRIELESQNVEKKFESHCEGELWGLDVINDNQVVTSCDDNQIKTWDLGSKKCIANGTVCEQQRRAKRGGASSLTSMADSQCARAVAVNKSSGHVAVGHNDGTVTIRASADKLNEVIATKNESREWIEAMSYSPDSSKLAVGSHDNNIYIYSASDYALLGTLKAHNSFIVSVDWSTDGKYIRSVCGAHELLFFTVEDFKQDPSGGSNTVETEWQTSSNKYGWLVEGIFPSGVDGTHINHVEFSPDGNHIATADDYGLVNIFKNPARSGAQPVSLRGHSEHVVRTKFAKGGDILLSVGGYDQCLI